jgi:hypothetical protein
MRTYTLQVEALARKRRKGEQTVNVKHVHVHAGGQAVVGNVTQKAGRGITKNEQRAYSDERQMPGNAKISDRTSVRSEDKDRDSLPITGDEKRTLQATRGRKG